jgi:hypothetical protein
VLLEVIVSLKFTIGGHAVQLSKEDVERALEGMNPDTVKKYWIVISGKQFPIKQALSVATNIPPAAFISTDAYRVLSRLGFEVKQ